MAGLSYINTNAATTGAVVGTRTQAATQMLAYMRGAKLIEPKFQALLTLTERAKQKRALRFSASDTTIRYFSKGTYPRSLVLLNAAGTGTALHFVDASMLEAGDIVGYLDENMRVTVVDTTTSPNEVTVVRNSPTKAGFATRTLAAGQIIQIIGMSRAEGADKPGMIGLQKNEHSNVNQIFSKGCGFSGTFLATDQWTQDDSYRAGVEEATHWCRLMLERAMWFQEGAAERIAVGTHNARGLMKGIPAHVLTNRFDAGGRMTFADFNEWMMACTRFGNNSHKVVFAGPVGLSIISQFPKSSIHRQQMDKVFGLNITRLFGAGGWTCDVVPNWHYEGDYGGNLMIADMDYFHLIPMKNRSFEQMAMHDVETPGADRKEFTILGEYTIALEIEQTWGLIENAWR
jgi:hypothetical protein